MTGRARACRDRGSAALELVVLAPVILMLIGVVIAAGRTSSAQSAIEAAARDAARQASIAPDYAAAQASALAALNSDGLACNPLSVNVHAGAFLTTTAGQPGLVWATVSCTVPLSDLWVPGLPGSRTMTATFYSPLDEFRER